MTDIYQQHNSQQDYFTRDRFEEKEGWAPSMYLREVASSQYNARQKGKHAAVRAMLRDTRLNSISVLAGKKNRIPARVDSLKSQFSGPSVGLSIPIYCPHLAVYKIFLFPFLQEEDKHGTHQPGKRVWYEFFLTPFKEYEMTIFINFVSS